MAILPELEDLAATNDQAAQKVKVFKDQLSDLDFEADTLRALEPAALAAQMKEAWGEGVKAFGEYQDELVKLEEKAAEDRLDVAEAVAEQDVKIREKAAGDLAKLEKEIAADRLEAVEDAAGEERKLRRREELEDRFELKRHLKDLRDLAFARNVDAYIEAQEDRDLDLEQQQAERGLDALERKEALDEELAQIKTSADAKAETIREGSEKELATLQENETKQLAALDERLEKERAAREEAFAKQITALTDSMNRQEDEAAKGYGALEDEFAAYLDEMGGDLAAFGLDAKEALADLATGRTGGAASETAGGEQAPEDRYAREDKYGPAPEIFGDTTSEASILERQRAVREQEARERQKALDEELRQVRESGAAKVAAVREQNEKELQAFSESGAKRLAALGEVLESELSAKEEAFARQLDALAGSLDRQADAAAKGYGALEDEFAGFLAGISGNLAAFGQSVKGALSDLTYTLEGRSLRSERGAGTTVQMTNIIENPTFGQLETPATVNQRFAQFQQQQAYLWERNARALNSLLVR
jgi:hypothetical protein